MQLEREKKLAEQKASQNAFSQLLMQATKKSTDQAFSQAHEASTNIEIAGHEGEQIEQESIEASDAVERLAALERMLNEWFAAPV